MIVDFTTLNVIFSKDPYPLPNINCLIDRSSRYKMLNFMDAYSRYNHINKDIVYTPKTTFRSNYDQFYYNVVPFRLKNTNTIYQRLMDVIFSK